MNSISPEFYKVVALDVVAYSLIHLFPVNTGHTRFGYHWQFPGGMAIPSSWQG